ncbi:MAG: UDP-N-acetylmuramoyl-L-alanine--D-glutamate ligase [Alphaproteobacteria bacterium]
MNRKHPIAVLGLARTGLSVIKALHQNTRIYAWDDDAAKREQSGVDSQRLTPEILKDCACLILSPGIPLDHPVVKAARAAGVQVICDIELFHRLYPETQTIGITGTNGKSTTTALTAHILKSCGLRAVAGGNIGVPVFDLSPDNILVLELSSYQLDLCPTFRPDIAVLLNISPDHLDRHGSMENYIQSKARILEGDGLRIVGVDDAYSAGLFGKTAQAIAISVNRPLEGKREFPALKGEHNYQNFLASYEVARHFNVPPADIFKAADSFPGLPHRQYPVCKARDVVYINDSKATNAEAAAKALGSFTNIYWIAGGRAKGGGLKGLEPFMKNVRHAYLIGEAMEEFSGWMLKNHVPFHLSETLDVAVQEASRAAQESRQAATVLLSPACASWDQYSSFEERGDHFSTLVQQLSEKTSS